ncbi:phage tail protein [Emticicia fontis]
MDEYIGIIKPFLGNFPPKNWLLCDGSLAPIGTFQVLYSLMGTRYGGDGIRTFGLPDLRGRIPIGLGTGGGLTPRNLGEKSGFENVTITPLTYPKHTHTYNGLTGSRETNAPTGNYLGIAAGNFYCQPDSGDTLLPMNDKTVSDSPGDNLPHDNMPPFLVVNFIICYNGIYPSRP